MACEENEINAIFLQDESHLIEELRIANPDILFIQASIIENFKAFNLIEYINEDEELGEIFVVIHTSRDEGSEYAFKMGGDRYLSVPFKKEQIEAILRQVLNRPKKIIYIGPQADGNNLLLKQLQDKGFQISGKTSGQEGMTFISTSFPDLVLCEHHLTDMVAKECIQSLKNNPQTKHIPIIMLSPTQDVEAIEEFLNLGAADIFLPPYESDVNLTKISNYASPPKKGKKEKALVVDDSPVIRNIISKMFKQLGFAVKTAGQGKEALALLDHYTPDIITTDYEMPVMDGWEFCSQLKEYPEAKEVPIIMITTKDSQVDFKKGELLGVSGYLPKPFQPDDLQKLVRAVLAESKAKKERIAISKYVAADAIKNVGDIIEGIKTTEPEEKIITIFFSDICSFTDKCERHNPKAIVRILNEYFDLMIDVLHKYNAIIDKLIGDAIVARFDSEDKAEDALMAANASMEMIHILEQFNENALEPINIRIGINSGNAILGNIGSQKYRLDFTMIGDSVNTAQRLESSAPINGCLISDTTYELIKDKVKVGESMLLEVKGKSLPVKAYRLLAIQ